MPEKGQYQHTGKQYNNMKIGDKVRLLHGTEEGIIRRIIDKRTVDIEIDDGFLIPALISELVLIDDEEIKRFKRPRIEQEIQPKDEPTSILFEEQGTFLAIEPQSNFVSLWLLNNEKNETLFSAYEERSSGLTGITKGILPGNNYVKLTDWHLKEQNNWPRIIIMQVKYHEQTQTLPETEIYTQSITGKILLKKPKFIGTLKRKAILLELRETQLTEKVNPQVLKEAMLGKPTSIEPIKDHIKRELTRMIDLHIESLEKGPMPPKEDILGIQKNEFERQLDKAVVDGLDSLLFIHGVGNGTLRHFIHKYLSTYPHLRYYEDAQKEKFGYGATKVYLK